MRKKIHNRKKFFLCSTTAVVLLFGFCQKANVGKKDTIEAEKAVYTRTIDYLDSRIEELIAENVTPGIAAAILDENGLVWEKYAGYADLNTEEMPTRDTIFRLASISKTFTATAIMKLWSDGRLDIDDPFMQYVPYFKIKTRYPEEKDAEGFIKRDLITIRHLLMHRSGLPREHDGFFTYYQDYEGHRYNLEDIARSVADKHTSYRVGERMKYSNLNMDLLGLVIESASGKDFATFMDEDVFKPLGMENSGFWITDEARSKMAKGHQVLMTGEDENEKPIMSFVEKPQPNWGDIPAGNVYSSIHDMVKFYLMFINQGKVNGKQFIKADLIQMMFKKNATPRDPRDYGFGLFIAADSENYSDPSYYSVAHGGNMPTGFDSMFIFSPKGKVGTLLFANSEGCLYPHLIPTVSQSQIFLHKERYGLEQVQPEPANPIDLDRPTLEKYGGIYGFNGNPVPVRLEASGLKIGLSEPALDLIPVGKNVFRAASGGKEVGLEIKFFVDEAGKRDLLTFSTFDTFRLMHTICDRLNSTKKMNDYWKTLADRKYDVLQSKINVKCGTASLSVIGSYLLMQTEKDPRVYSGLGGSMILEPVADSKTELIIVSTGLAEMEGETIYYEPDTGILNTRSRYVLMPQK